MGRMVDVDDLISSADVSALLGVTRQATSNWKQRIPTFPKPVATVGPKKNIDLYLRSEVLPWLVERLTPDLRATLREELNTASNSKREE